jgi:hypothetical protein
MGIGRFGHRGGLGIDVLIHRCPHRHEDCREARRTSPFLLPMSPFPLLFVALLFADRCFVSFLDGIQLELTLDDIKWAIVGHRKLKIREEKINIIQHNNRIRIYVDDEENRYFRLRSIKRQLGEIVVKVRIYSNLLLSRWNRRPS